MINLFSYRSAYKKIIAGVFILQSYVMHGQDTTMQIPRGVVYKTATEQANKRARDIIERELSGKETGILLFDSVVIIGPILWEKYLKVPAMAAIKEGNVSLKMSSFDPKQNKRITELVAAKLIQRKEDYLVLLQQLRKDIEGKSLKFRKLNSLDMKYYWSVIFFDIEEPVYIVEVNGRKFLFDLGADNKLKWIDEVL